jgi:penicillin amidase
MLAEWDGDLTVSTRGGPLYAVWIERLTAEMYGLHPGFPIIQDRGDLRRLHVVIPHLLEPDEAWFGIDAVARRNALLQKTLASAVKQVKPWLGDDPSLWSWGRLHQCVFHHPLETLGSEVAGTFNLGPVARGGDSSTPMYTGYDQDFQQTNGATYRQVFDLADWDLGTATSAPGQSGQPGSPHYGDLLPMWAAGEYFPLAFSRDRVEHVTEHRMLLVPVHRH